MQCFPFERGDGQDKMKKKHNSKTTKNVVTKWDETLVNQYHSKPTLKGTKPELSFLSSVTFTSLF